MRARSRIWCAVLLVVNVACGRPDGRSSDTAAIAEKSANATSPSSAANAPNDPVPLYTQERRTDLTGDGSPERLVLVTQGARWDSLDVRLEIRSAADTVLYARQWNSRDYFKYDTLGGKSDSAVQRIVRRQLERVLADSAFRKILPGPDSATVRYDIAEQEWRTANHVSPLEPLPTRASADIMSPGNTALRVSDAHVAALTRELKGRPTFTYFAGGESTTTLAWSAAEHRFVRVFECC